MQYVAYRVDDRDDDASRRISPPAWLYADRVAGHNRVGNFVEYRRDVVSAIHLSCEQLMNALKRALFALLCVPLAQDAHAALLSLSQVPSCWTVGYAIASHPAGHRQVVLVGAQPACDDQRLIRPGNRRSLTVHPFRTPAVNSGTRFAEQSMQCAAARSCGADAARQDLTNFCMRSTRSYAATQDL